MNMSEYQILIADDEPSNVSTVVSLLGAIGIKKGVFSAPNGEVALKIAQEKKPDLIITDWQMPKMSGLDLVRAINDDDSLKGTKIIMVTAVMTASEQLKEAFDHGVHDFIRKPFDNLEFFARVTNTLKLLDAERELKKQYNQLQIVDEAKTRFFINIAHDLRLPLTLILGQSEILLDQYDEYLPMAVEKKVELIKQSGKKLEILVEEISELIKLDQGEIVLEKQNVPFAELLYNVLDIIQPIADNKKIQLSASLELGKQENVYIDPNRFEKVLFNLLSNSLKYTPANGKINVSCQHTEQGFSIAVSDTGEGIKKEDIPRIFDRYFKHRGNVKSVRTGLGIGVGLALSKEIINAHGGNITAESSEEGTTIHILIPDVAPPENIELQEFGSQLDKKAIILEDYIDNVSKVSGDSVAQDETKSTILLIEDNEDIRNFISEILMPEYNIVEAVNGEDALNKIKLYPIDLIVTDLLMPAMDGFQFLKTLRENEQYANLPGLILSSRYTEEDQLTALDYGVNNFLKKPFKAEELKLRLKNLLTQTGASENAMAEIFSNYDLDQATKKMITRMEQLVISRIDDSKLGINDLAQEVAFSERKLFRFLKDNLEVTPLEFIKQIRFQQVRKLIKQAKVQSISEAARAIGMNNVSLFKMQYKNRFGEEAKF